MSDEPSVGALHTSVYRVPTCVAGLRAVTGAAPRPPLAARCARLADTLVTAASAASLHPDGHGQRAPGLPPVDAALLLPAVRGALRPDDARTRAACRHDLARELFFSRFRHDGRPLEAAEGAFLLCGFIMAPAEAQQGNTTAALSAAGAAGVALARRQKSSVPHGPRT
ncbi:hypothetical protein [Streptomyces sp. VRA16 Mangrove soil]|uniref:hypothetical protein n=1 Tax=Streptomyces sp. VRA16 Mangrove soil TaxID=2817434 RepID=UPI001A9DFB18|nr:hypothetical protein [Streptomyces sp. VRA16 Mangrove soil]MBO1335701.1 hypothetical protein [Streptomyces sp. VRA16 Mangrove soil]